MTTILRNGINLFLCVTLFACGSHTKSKDPLPIATPPTTGGSLAPTVLAPITPTNPTAPSQPTVVTVPTTNEPTILPTGPIATLASMGTADGFEIGTWNIENYPKSTGSKAMVSSILNQLDVDVMAVEEISSEGAFKELVAEMPKFSGVLAGEGNGKDEAQNVGFIYRKADFTLVKSEALFETSTFAFPRPPLMIRLKPVKAGRAEIVAIAVHLKAFGDDKSQQRREIANGDLQNYVAELKAKEPALQIVILGDFNQPLIQESERKVFSPWFERAGSYTVRTDALVQRGDYSYFSGQYSLIDHIITTNDFLLAEPVIVKLQNVIPGYEANASDHLPVITRLP